MFIAFLYMFRATTCPSSGENSVPMRHLVFANLYRVTNIRCRISMEFSPDDEHIVARNM